MSNWNKWRDKWNRTAGVMYGSTLYDKSTRDHFQQQAGLESKPLPPEPYTSGSPYAEGAGGMWDAQGFPTGQMPRGQYALDWQYEANRRAEQRRTALWGDAQNVMRQGTDMLQSYRPGGSAALASGAFQARASLYGNQAMSTEAPDLLMGYRERKQMEADAERAQAERFSRTMSIITAGASLFGAGAGGGAAAALGGAAAGASLAQMGGAQSTISPEAMSSLGGGGGTVGVGNLAGDPVAGGGGGQQAVGGGQMSPAWMQYAPGNFVQGGQAANAGGGGAMQLQAGGDGPSGGAGAGAGGARGGITEGPGSGGGGGGQAAGGRAGGAMQAAPGSPAPMASFHPVEAAANAMVASKAAQMTVYGDWSDDDYRQVGTVLQAMSARMRLMRAQNYSGAGF